jgi:hypothetical protein
MDAPGVCGEKKRTPTRTPPANWNASLGPVFAQVGAFPLSAGTRDAAPLVTLPAGNTYTVQVSGVNNGTGEALIEIYEVF